MNGWVIVLFKIWIELPSTDGIWIVGWYILCLLIIFWYVFVCSISETGKVGGLRETADGWTSQASGGTQGEAQGGAPHQVAPRTRRGRTAQERRRTSETSVLLSHILIEVAAVCFTIINIFKLITNVHWFCVNIFNIKIRLGFICLQNEKKKKESRRRNANKKRQSTARRWRSWKRSRKRNDNANAR